MLYTDNGVRPRGALRVLFAADTKWPSIGKVPIRSSDKILLCSIVIRSKIVTQKLPGTAELLWRSDLSGPFARSADCHA